MAIQDLTQSERSALSLVKPIYLVDWVVGALTLRFSDRGLRYRFGSQEYLYEPYLLSLSRLGESVIIDGNFKNSDVILILSNERWSSYNNLSSLMFSENLVRTNLTIYELLLSGNLGFETEIFSSDVRKVKQKLVVEELFDVSLSSFSLRCSSRLYNKKNSWGNSKITKSLYPYADPNDVGKIRNSLYGSLEKVPSKCVLTGGIDTLPIDITASATSISVSGVAQVAFLSSGTIQIDDEKISYTGFNTSTFTFSGCSRGASSTTAAVHSKGAAVSQVRTSYVYEIAKHPVRSITNVFVDDVRQIMYPTSGYVCRAYTGQPGQELSGYEGRAVVSFSTNPIVKKQINVEVSQEHSHYTSTGSHYHSNSVESSTTRTVTGASSYQNVENPAFAYDGSTTTYARIRNGSLSRGFIWLTKNSSSSLGTLTRVEIGFRIRTSGISSNTGFRLGYGSEWHYITSNYSSATNVSFSFGSSDWGGYVGVRFDNLDFPSNPDAYVDLYNINSITMYYTLSATQASPATGVSTTMNGNTVVSGQTTADVVIGDEVTVDCEGFFDDASGTITGVSGALIERPDHVFRHFLVNLCGFLISDIGSSFSTAGSAFSALSYKFAFIIHDIGTDGFDIISKLAFQCRSILFEWEGLFEIKVLPDSSPSADFVVESSDVVDLPTFSFSPSYEIFNKITAYYRPDWRSRRANGDVRTNPINSEANAAGYMDALVGSSVPSDLEKDLLLRAVRTSVMAQNLLDFYLSRMSIPKTYLNIKINWRYTDYQPGQCFSFSDGLMGLATYRILKLTLNLEKDEILFLGEKT